MSVGPISNKGAVEAAIARGAEASGADFSLLLETARRESSFNPSAKAPTSSASGLFQFIEQTWLEMVARHGAKHGLGQAAGAIEQRNGRAFVGDPAQRRDILNLRFDPELAARMAGELARENGAALAQRLRRPPTGGEIYAAHVLGPAGAARLIDAAAQGQPDASALFPREAQANRWLFNDASGAPRSAQGLLARLDITGAASAPLQPQDTPARDVARPDRGLQIGAHDPALIAAFVDLLMATSSLAALQGQTPEEDPLAALAAYRRWDKT
jgi:hypothetical protein